MTTLIEVDANGKILHIVMPAANTEVYYPEYISIEEQIPPGSTHYIDGKFYIYPDLDNTKQSKLAVIKSLLLSKLCGQFNISGNTFYFEAMELGLILSMPDAACSLVNTNNVLITLSKQEVRQLKDTILTRWLAMHNIYNHLRYSIIHSTSINELEAIDLSTL